MNKEVFATPELLILNGFEETKGPVIDNYGMNISRNELEFKRISITLENGNQYIMVREGDLNSSRHKDDVVVIYNSDYDGNLKMYRLNNLIYGLTGKWLKAVDSIKSVDNKK